MLRTQSSSLAVRDPIVMGLIMLMVLLERVIKRTIKPVELGDGAEVEGHLRIVIRLVVVARTDRVKSLVQIRVHDTVTQIVLGLLPIVLGEDGRVEVDC